jgi:hypothetical protein
VHDFFVQEGATNVVWVWCPNFDSVPNQTWNDFRNYKAQWIADSAAARKLQFPSIAAFVWFDSNHSPDDYRVNSSPAALSAYGVVAADPYFTR